MPIADLFNEDCLKRMSLMGECSIDLSIAHPPYSHVMPRGQFDFNTTARELFRITRDGAVVFWLVGDVHGRGGVFEQCVRLQQIGFTLNEVVIVRSGRYSAFLPQRPDRHINCTQYGFVLVKGDAVRVFNRMQHGDTWFFPPDEHQDEISHKLFPEIIPTTVIETWTEPNGVVFDPFTGCGTTAVAAIKTGRRFIGTEIEPILCGHAQARIDKLLRKEN